MSEGKTNSYLKGSITHDIGAAIGQVTQVIGYFDELDFMITANPEDPKILETRSKIPLLLDEIKICVASVISTQSFGHRFAQSSMGIIEGITTTLPVLHSLETRFEGSYCDAMATQCQVISSLFRLKSNLLLLSSMANRGKAKYMQQLSADELKSLDLTWEVDATQWPAPFKFEGRDSSDLEEPPNKYRKFFEINQTSFSKLPEYLRNARFQNPENALDGPFQYANGHKPAFD
ncbi:hypothetical protein PG995_009662 [Apiospora arundinis]